MVLSFSLTKILDYTEDSVEVLIKIDFKTSVAKNSFLQKVRALAMGEEQSPAGVSVNIKYSSLYHLFGLTDQRIREKLKRETNQGQFFDMLRDSTTNFEDQKKVNSLSTSLFPSFIYCISESTVAQNFQFASIAPDEPLYREM